MIKKVTDFKIITEEECCGGVGKAVLGQVLTAKDTYEKVPAYAIVTLGPEDSVGYHIHHGDMEIYTVLKGTAIFNDNGTEVILQENESGITYDGEGHAIRPASGEELQFLACTIKK